MSEKKALLEAALFISARGMSANELSELVGVEAKEVAELMDELRRDYESRGSGLEVVKQGRSYTLQVRPEHEETVFKLAPVADMPKTVLKTLALIAHEEPIKQSKLIAMRGNRAYYYIKKLRELDLVSAKKSGRTRMLTTTPKFKEYFSVETVKGVVKEPEIEKPEEAGKPEDEQKTQEIRMELK